MLGIISTLVLVIIAAGLFFRRRAKLHATLMSIAFSLDLALLLDVEFTRHAIEKLGENIQHATPDGLLYFHVTISVLMLLLYGVQIFSGRRLLHADETRRALHRKSGYLFLVCRLINYVTAFMVATP